MKVKATTLFSSPIFGNVHPGDVLTVNESEFKHFLSLGLVEAEQKQKPKIEPKKTQQRPKGKK